MWVFLCVIALGSLLTPSVSADSESYTGMENPPQQCPDAQLTVCKGTLIKMIGEAVKKLPLLENLNLDSVLNLGGDKEKSKGNSGGSLLGGLLDNDLLTNVGNTVGNTVGMKIINVAIADIDIELKPKELVLKLKTCVELAIASSITNILSSVPIPLQVLSSGNAASGSTKIKLEIITELTFKMDVTKKGNIVLGFEKKDCKILNIKIKVVGGLLGDDGTVGSVIAPLKHIVTDQLKGVTNKLVCGTVFPLVLNTVSSVLNSLCGILPGAGQMVKYAVSAVSCVGGCLVAKINPADKGRPKNVDTTCVPAKLPKMQCDGLVMSKAMLDMYLKKYLSLEKANKIVKSLGEIEVPNHCTCELFSELAEEKTVILAVTLLQTFEIMLNKDGKIKLKTRLRVEASGKKTGESVFIAEMDAEMEVDAAIKKGMLCFMLNAVSCSNIEIKCENTLEESDVKEMLESGAERVMEEFNKEPICIPLPKMIKDTEKPTMTCDEGALVIDGSGEKKSSNEDMETDTDL